MRTGHRMGVGNWGQDGRGERGTRWEGENGDMGMGYSMARGQQGLEWGEARSVRRWMVPIIVRNRIVTSERALRGSEVFRRIADKSEYERPDVRPSVVTLFPCLYFRNHWTDSLVVCFMG